MKNIYNKPELKNIAIEEEVAIAANTSTVYNIGFDGGDYNAPTYSDEWEW